MTGVRAVDKPANPAREPLVAFTGMKKNMGGNQQLWFQAMQFALKRLKKGG